MGEKQIVREVLLNYYVHHGKGVPLLFLHGLGSNYTVWKKLFRDRFCIALDLRGHGKSGSGFSSIDDLLLDIHAIIDREHVQKAVLVGTSFGSLLAKRFADRFPEKVKGLVLISPYGGDIARCSAVIWLFSVFLHRLSSFIPFSERRFQDYSKWKPLFFPVLDMKGTRLKDFFATARLMLKKINLHELKHQTWLLYGVYDPLIRKNKLLTNVNVKVIPINTHHHVVSNRPDLVWKILEAI